MTIIDIIFINTSDLGYNVHIDNSITLTLALKVWLVLMDEAELKFNGYKTVLIYYTLVLLTQKLL